MLKKLVMAAAVVALAAPAMASKARLTALSAAPHLSDIQDITSKAYTLNDNGQFATFEWGSSAYGSAPHAEGGFAKNIGAGHLGIYLGGTPTWVSDARSAFGALTTTQFGTTPLQKVDNPFYVGYGAKAGDLSWGAGLTYESSNNKTSKTKSSVTGLGFSVAQGAWDAALNLGLGNTMDNEATAAAVQTFKGSSAAVLQGSYIMNDWFFQGAYTMNGGKFETAGSTTNNKTLEQTKIQLDAINTMKIDGGSFFWGASYITNTVKQTVGTSGKKEDTSLPFVFGVEADAASWLVLRGSLSQNVLLGSSKNDIAGAGAESDTVANNTTAAAGVGIKFNKFTLDGTLAGATGSTASGELNGNKLLANGSLTYKF